MNSIRYQLFFQAKEAIQISTICGVLHFIAAIYTWHMKTISLDETVRMT